MTAYYLTGYTNEINARVLWYPIPLISKIKESMFNKSVLSYSNRRYLELILAAHAPAVLGRAIDSNCQFCFRAPKIEAYSPN
jgi:hypothetical protein